MQILKYRLFLVIFSTRMMLAALTSLIVSIFLGPYFIRKLYELKKSAKQFEKKNAPS